MVEDEPDNLRAQPVSLIHAPMFYPPATPTNNDINHNDTFLLQLIGILDELEAESNFANYISSEGWNIDVSQNQDRYVKKGLSILSDNHIDVDASQTGPIGCPSHERRLPYKIGTTVVASPISSSGPRRPLIGAFTTVLSMSTNQPIAIIGQANMGDTGGLTSLSPILSLKPLGRSPSLDVGPPTPSTPISVTSDTDNESMSSDGWASLDERFVEEEEERARDRRHPLPLAHSPIERLDHAVDDWAQEVRSERRGGETVPPSSNAPYEEGWRSYRRDEWDPNDDIDDY